MTSPIRTALPYEFNSTFRGYAVVVTGFVNDAGLFGVEHIYPTDSNIPEPDYNSLSEEEIARLAEEFDHYSIGDDMEDFGDEDYESEDYADSDEDEFPDESEE